MVEYHWQHPDLLVSHRYLLPAISKWVRPGHNSILDLGCGNGALTAQLAATSAAHARNIVGIDASLSGLDQARRAAPSLSFKHHVIEDPLPDYLRKAFDLVIAAEVIEHLLLPRNLFARAKEALRPNGHLIITTPDHNYWKNLALAAANRFDTHWDPLADYGHIKFFSRNTLTRLGLEQGFQPVHWQYAGRARPFAKSLCALLELTRSPVPLRR